VAKSVAKLAIHAAWKKANCTSLGYTTQPKGLYAQAAHKEGAIKLVPLSATVAIAPATDRKPPGSQVLGVECDSPKGIMATYAASVPPPSEKSSKEMFVSPFFLVRRSENPEKTNMRWSTMPTAITYGGHEVSVPVPIMTNAKAVTQNDELIMVDKPSPSSSISISGATVSQAPRGKAAPMKATKGHTAAPKAAPAAATMAGKLSMRLRAASGARGESGGPGSKRRRVS